MKRFLAPLLLFLATVLTAHAASPTFGQVMWSNDLAKVLLSPERSTNRVQLPTNLVTFGGVSSSFPAFWRENTTINARLADNSAFAPFTAGQIRSRNQGMILDTEDSATAFAYNFLFRKKGGTGGTNDPISAETELGNLQWQGWDGSAFVTGAGWLPKAEQAWSGSSTGARMELRLSPSNSVGFAEAFRFVMVNSTNAMLTFNGGGSISASQPALKRFGRQIQIRSADDSGFADITASIPTFGSNQVNLGFLSSILGGSGNVISNPSPMSVIAGGETNGIGESVFGHNTISGGWSNRISNLSSNNTIAGGYGNFTDASTRGASIGGGYSNRVQQIFGTVSGGSGNFAGGSHGTVAGGQQNVAGTTSAADFNTVGGGRGNLITGFDYGTIAGGETNNLLNNALHAVIDGGRGNSADAELASISGGGRNNIAINSHHSFIGGGISNNVNATAPMAAVVGSFGTNNTTKSVLISPAGTHGPNRLHVVDGGTTNIGKLMVTAHTTAAYVGVGGTLFSTNVPVVNAGVAETNLAAVSIPAHTLSNLNSTLVIEASGSMAKSIAGTNQIRLLFGSSVLLDTGLQTASNGWYRIRATISSSALTAGFTNQFTSADHFWWGTGVTGMPFRDTNFNNWATQTNGIATTLRLATTSLRNGGITNESFTVRWYPSTP